MSILVPIIVAAIIALQIFFFVKNVLRMRDYKKSLRKKILGVSLIILRRISFLVFMDVVTMFLNQSKNQSINT